MTLQTFLRALAAFLALFFAGCGQQQSVPTTPQVSDAWARETATGQTMAAAYFSLGNPGNAPIRLVSAKTPVAAASSIHESKVSGGVASMKMLDNGLVIAPGETVTFKPGGLHVMLEGLNRGLGEGDEVALTLTFEDDTSLTVPVRVRPAGAR